jgi:hypothetical protein
MGGKMVHCIGDYYKHFISGRNAATLRETLLREWGKEYEMVPIKQETP